MCVGLTSWERAAMFSELSWSGASLLGRLGKLFSQTGLSMALEAKGLRRSGPSDHGAALDVIGSCSPQLISARRICLRMVAACGYSGPAHAWDPHIACAIFVRDAWRRRSTACGSTFLVSLWFPARRASRHLHFVSVLSTALCLHTRAKIARLRTSQEHSASLLRIGAVVDGKCVAAEANSSAAAARGIEPSRPRSPAHHGRLRARLPPGQRERELPSVGRGARVRAPPSLRRRASPGRVQSDMLLGRSGA